MTRASCPRLWQVEAARDGRLGGSDLSNALRHRAECADCGQAARAFDELARQLKTLPVPVLDSLAQRRTRQALFSAWNTQLLAEPRREVRPRVLLAVAFCALSGVALALGYPLMREVARPTESANAAQLSRADSRAQPLALTAPQSTSPSAPAPQATALAPEPAKAGSSVEAKVRAMRPKPAGDTDTAVDTAEDDAYLEIVELLRNRREPEARTKASQYLQRFPHGFRRLEVGKIAAH